MSTMNVSLPPSPVPQRTLSLITWPIAILCGIKAVYIGLQGAITNDYLTVFNAVNRFFRHQAVYVEDLNSVNPHYLYPPSGSLLLTPLAWITYDHGRLLIIVGSVLAITLGVILLGKQLDLSATHPIIPVILILFFHTESVIHSLSFTNINGFLFLCLAIFLCALQSPYSTVRILGALALGLSLSIKPIFITLLIILVLYKQWKMLIISVAVPIVLNLIAFPLTVDGFSFVTRIVPYITHSRSFYNSAIPGIYLYYGISSWLILITRIFLGAIVVTSLIILWKISHQYPIIFTYTFTGLSLVGTFLLGSLGQGYYSMFLLPLLLTVFFRHGVGRNPYVWIGAFLCLDNGPWRSFRWQYLSRCIEFWRMPLGWTIIIIASATTIITYYLVQKKRNATISAS